MKRNNPANTIVAETALLCESALAEGWNCPKEDEAWTHLQDAAQTSFDFWDNLLDDADWNNA